MIIKNVSGSYRYFGYGEPAFGLADNASSDEISDDIARNPLFQEDVTQGIIEVTSGAPAMSISNETGSSVHFSYATPGPAPVIVEGYADDGARVPEVPADIASDLAYVADLAAHRIAEQAKFKVTFTAGTGGTIDDDADQDVDYNEDCVMVTAEPDEANDYVFVRWDGLDEPSTEAELTILNVVRNMNVTAVFAKNTYRLRYVAGPNGTIGGNLDQTVESGADGTEVEAFPATGYDFNNWDDAVVDNPRIDEEVSEDVQVIALFTAQVPDP